MLDHCPFAATIHVVQQDEEIFNQMVGYLEEEYQPILDKVFHTMVGGKRAALTVLLSSRSSCVSRLQVQVERRKTKYVTHIHCDWFVGDQGRAREER